jgi:hypothetical protein
MLRGVDNYYLSTLFQTAGLVTGGVGSIALFASLPLFFFRFRKSAATYQSYLAIATLPWSNQALIAAISDSFPLNNYHKRYYVVAAMLALPLALLGIVLSQTAECALVFIVTVSTAVVVIHTLFSGTTSNIVAFHGADTSLVSYASGFRMACTLIGAVVVGLVGDPANGSLIWIAYVVAIPLALQALFPLLMYPNRALPHDAVVMELHLVEPLLHGTLVGVEGVVDDEYADGVVVDDGPRRPRHGVYDNLSARTQQTRLTGSEWILVAWLSVVSLILAITLAAGDPSRPITVAVFLPLVVLVSVKLLHQNYKDRPVLEGSCVFMFLHGILCVDIEGPMNAFMTSGDSCVVNGPHFDLTFYIAFVNVVAAVSGVAAALVYNTPRVRKWTTRSIVQVGLLIRMLGGVCDISIINGWNTGVPNEVLYTIDNGFFVPFGTMFIEIAMATHIASVVYRGKSTTTNAVVLSFTFLGQALSKIGGLILSSLVFNVRANRYTGCNFDGLVPLVVFAEIISPFLAISIAYLLVPSISYPGLKGGAAGCVKQWKSG